MFELDLCLLYLCTVLTESKGCDHIVTMFFFFNLYLKGWRRGIKPHYIG